MIVKKLFLYYSNNYLFGGFFTGDIVRANNKYKNLKNLALFLS